MTIRTRMMILATAALLVGVAGCPKNGADAPSKKPVVGKLAADARQPNIIFIMIDTLRADRVGVYGCDKGLTPNIDAIAKEGLVFADTVAAAPWTLPSVGSLFTGYYPSVHKAISYSEISRSQRAIAALQQQGRPAPTISILPDELQTLAEAMQVLKYETAAFSANGFIQKEFGFGQGFDTFVNCWKPEQNSVPAPDVMRPALEWLDTRKNPAKPFFLYLHFMDVHGPYNAAPRFMDPLMAKFDTTPPTQRMTADEFERINAYMRKPPEPLTRTQAEYWAKFQRTREYWDARYDAGVAQMDDYIGQVVAALRERGVWDDAYVILLADHGEALNDHSGFWEHGYSQYQTDLAVPMILRLPGVVPAGRVETRVSLIDLMPTVIDQFGRDTGNLQGQSLVSFFPGNTNGGGRPHFAEALKFWGGEGDDGKAVFDGKWKYFEMPVKQGVAPLLFDLQADPGETNNLAATEAAVASRLKTALNEQVIANTTVKPDVTVKFVVVSGQSQNQLGTTGYIGDDHAEEKVVDLRAMIGIPDATADQLKEAVTQDNRAEIGALLEVDPPSIKNIHKKIDGLFEDIERLKRKKAEAGSADDAEAGAAP